jgi:glc operon protein GlcG
MPLITRNHPQLTLEGARAVLAAAQQCAIGMRCPVNVAVVDDGAHLLAFERMDGAKPSSIQIALVKAQAAAMRRAPTGPAMMGEHVNLPLSLGLAAASPSDQTPIRGGVPLIVDGEVVGAIGVSAGTEDQDADIARAGAAALENA